MPAAASSAVYAGGQRVVVDVDDAGHAVARGVEGEVDEIAGVAPEHPGEVFGRDDPLCELDGLRGRPVREVAREQQAVEADHLAEQLERLRLVADEVEVEAAQVVEDRAVEPRPEAFAAIDLDPRHVGTGGLPPRAGGRSSVRAGGRRARSR